MYPTLFFYEFVLTKLVCQKLNLIFYLLSTTVEFNFRSIHHPEHNIDPIGKDPEKKKLFTAVRSSILPFLPTYPATDYPRA